LDEAGQAFRRVPLSPGAVAVLDEVRPLMKAPADLVFRGGRKNVPLSDMPISAWRVG
jgi:hypothetical protein